MEATAIKRVGMPEDLRGEAQGYTERKTELLRLPENSCRDSSLSPQRPASKMSSNSADLRSTGWLLLRADDNSRRKRRSVLRKLLTIELILSQLNCCTTRVLKSVLAMDPEGYMESIALNGHTENNVHGLRSTRHMTETYLPSTSLELDTISAHTKLPVDNRKTEIQQPIIAAPLAGLRVASATKGSRFSALSTEENATAQAINPWEGLLDIYDVPRVHGSGVKVDLGNEKTFGSKRYREPGGYCPVYGKFIQLHQPTGNSKIWPNDYLVAVPLAGSPQDTTPLGGGFGLPIPSISPHTLDQLKERVKQADSLANPHPYMMYYRRQIKDNLGYCVWWTRISPALDPKNTSTDLDTRYRYAIVWDEKNKLCTLLYVNMQEMTGAGTYCTRGNDKPVLTWYCFSSVKAVSMKERVWTSPYTRMDHATTCPKNGLKHVHWGQWNGNECQKLAPRKRVVVEDAAECAISLFDNSPSDNPTRYVGDEGRDWGQIHSNAPGVLFPAGAIGRDQPHSRGVGVNWANYYPKSKGDNPREKNECEMYDGVPDCLTLAPDGFAFVSLASPDPKDATLPPCAPKLEGAFVGGPCKCPPNTQQGWRCTGEMWEEGEEPCTCEKTESTLNAWVIAGPIIGIGALLGIAAAYMISRRSRARAPTQRDTIEDESREHQVQQRKTQTDLLQEAEPSFWKEATEEDPTVVLYDGDQMDQEF